jgi:hypothetical protein
MGKENSIKMSGESFQEKEKYVRPWTLWEGREGVKTTGNFKLQTHSKTRNRTMTSLGSQWGRVSRICSLMPLSVSSP